MKFMPLTAGSKAAIPSSTTRIAQRSKLPVTEQDAVAENRTLMQRVSPDGMLMVVKAPGTFTKLVEAVENGAVSVLTALLIGAPHLWFTAAAEADDDKMAHAKQDVAAKTALEVMFMDCPF
jgi:hypothetical protein